MVIAFHWRLVAALCAGLLLSSGCGDTGNRQAIEGTVTIDGQPLDEGQITFLPQEGTEGPTAGAPVHNGKFVVAQEQGVFAGHFRVEITAVRPTGKTIADPETDQVIDDVEQYLPDRYNRESELTAEVKPGEINQLEFALETR